MKSLISFDAIFWRTSTDIQFVQNMASSNVKLSITPTLQRAWLAKINPNVSPACDRRGHSPADGSVHPIFIPQSLTLSGLIGQPIASNPLTALFGVSYSIHSPLKSHKQIIFFNPSGQTTDTNGLETTHSFIIFPTDSGHLSLPASWGNSSFSSRWLQHL